MTAGIEIVVENGMATIDFVDPAAKGPAMQKLVDAGASVEKLSHSGPRIRYRVREDVAKAAGLLTRRTKVEELQAYPPRPTATSVPFVAHGNSRDQGFFGNAGQARRPGSGR